MPNRSGKTVEEQVKEIVAQQLMVDEDSITMESRFAEDLTADSLDCVELIMAFEEAFDIEISEEDADKLTTVKDAVEYIAHRVSA